MFFKSLTAKYIFFYRSQSDNPNRRRFNFQMTSLVLVLLCESDMENSRK